MEYRIDFENMPWERPMAGVRAKAVIFGSRRLRLVEYTREMPPHWCERGHAGCVLEGRLEITTDAGSFVCGPGDGIILPAGREHRHMAQALTDMVRVVFVEDVE